MMEYNRRQYTTIVEDSREVDSVGESDCRAAQYGQNFKSWYLFKIFRHRYDNTIHIKSCQVLLKKCIIALLVTI